MKYETIIYRVDGERALIRLNRPHRLNAVTLRLYDEVENAIHQAESDSAVRVIVISGEGRAFCVGADLKEHKTAERTHEQKRTYAHAEQRVCGRIQRSPKPFIAAVNGYALGAGAEIALSCDFVVMKDDAQIGFPEISIGTYLGGGLTYTLPRLVGIVKARELIFLGKRINGTEAESMGLIYRSVPEAEFDATVESLAQEIAGKAPIPTSFAKMHLLRLTKTEMDAVLENEAEALLKCMETDDWREGLRAFEEKRKPDFKGK